MDTKPGKKGVRKECTSNLPLLLHFWFFLFQISLTPEQYQELKAIMPEIDQALP